MIQVSELDNDKFFLLVPKTWGKKLFLLDAEKIKNSLYKTSQEVNPECIFGFLYYSVSPIETSPKPFEVNYSWAKKGYGPMLYEVGMVDAGWLHPDQNAVGIKAKPVWEKFSKREDVAKRRLYYENYNENYLDYMYRLSKPSFNILKILKEGKETFNRIVTENHSTPETIILELEDLATELFLNN